MSNRLAAESSPYLLQHKDNPVDWYPWGPEALDRAKREDKPIFLSIGYSACHWCHVMEHESFENAEIAQGINEAFVSIKVDREERPDLDQIYMNAVQVLTGHGGWPMSVFLTPSLEPFYGGTYWPPHTRGGMPGFDQIIAAVGEAWQDRREQALAGAQHLTEQLNKMADLMPGGGELSAALLGSIEADVQRSFDRRQGGFGSAPKFPHPMVLQSLLRIWRRKHGEQTLEMVRTTLDRMAAGGIYDHLAGGFARYSVDARWLVPHFEKMLYDNALLAGAYLDGLLATGDANYARVVRGILDYTLRDMTDPAGGFYSTQDADSEGEEGKFYVWTLDEVVEVLGAEKAETFAYVYDVTESGNFEGDGKNILNLPKSIAQCAAMRGRKEVELAGELADSRQKLLEVRNRRVRPGRDDKVLVSWNGLMIDAMARAAGPLGEPRYRDAAIQAADFILGNLRRSDGRLLHTWRAGQAKLDAYLDDYASLANALVSLYEASFQERFIDEAVRLADTILEFFSDERGGGFYYTASDHESLIARPKEITDSSVPSGNALAATALLKLGRLCGSSRYTDAAIGTLRSATGLIQRAPLAAGQMLLALDLHLGPTPEIVVLGAADEEQTAAVLSDLQRRYLPNKVVAVRPVKDGPPDRSAALDPLFSGKQPEGSGPTVFVCENFTCQAPVSGREAILKTWDDLAKGTVMGSIT